MYIYIHMYIYVYDIYVYLYSYIYTNTCTYIYTLIHMYVHIYVVDILHLPQLPDQSWGVEFWLRIACLIPDRHRINSRTEARSAIGLLRDNNHIHTFCKQGKPCQNRQFLLIGTLPPKPYESCKKIQGPVSQICPWGDGT